MNSMNEERLLEIGFKKVGNYLVGKIKNGFFTIVDSASESSELLISFGIGKTENKGLLFTFLDEYIKKEIIVDYKMDSETIEVRYNEKEINDISFFIKELASKMEELQMRCECSNCEHTENLGFYSNGVVPLLLCDECGQAVISKIQSEKNAKNNYVKGFLFALIGALLGSILWIILGAVGFYASIAGYAIAVAAFKGYEKAKGKLTGFGIGLNIIAIIFGFLFAEYAGLYIEFYRTVDVVDKSLQTFHLVTNILLRDSTSGFLKSILLDVLIGSIFIVLGCHRTISLHIKNAKEQKNFKVEKILPLDNDL